MHTKPKSWGAFWPLEWNDTNMEWTISVARHRNYDYRHFLFDPDPAPAPAPDPDPKRPFKEKD